MYYLVKSYVTPHKKLSTGNHYTDDTRRSLENTDLVEADSESEARDIVREDLEKRFAHLITEHTDLTFTIIVKPTLRRKDTTNKEA